MKQNEAVQAQAIAKGAGEKFLEEMGFTKGTPEFDNELHQLKKDAGVKEDARPAKK